MLHTDLFSTSLRRGRLPLLAAPLMASIVSDHNWMEWTTCEGWAPFGKVGEKGEEGYFW